MEAHPETCGQKSANACGKSPDVRQHDQQCSALAIVVVGSMLATLLLTRCLMPVLYSFYGERQPPEDAGGMAH